MTTIRADRDVINIGSVTATNFTINTGSGVKRDVFRPSFYVPQNPSEVLLEFGLPLDDSEPRTPEAKVLRKVLCKDVSQKKTRIISIHGKAGVGKSVILRGLCDEKLQERFREHFPDGIYFLSLGMDATMATVIHGLAEITRMCGGEELGRELRGEVNLRVALKKVREWMKGRKCLVLLDDLWERNGLGGGTVRELARVLSDGSGSVLVITTRFLNLATVGSRIKVEEREADSEEAKAILLRYAKLEQEEIEDGGEEAFLKLLKMCSGLPLFLSVVGRGVAELAMELECEEDEEHGRKLVLQKYWEELLVVGQDELFDTESDEYPDLSVTLQLSLELLSARRGKRLGALLLSKLSFQEMHRALCVFKKQARIPISVCRRLWNAENDEAAFWIAKWFAGVGLADVEIIRHGEEQIEYVRLHDLVHMFAVKCATDEREVAKWHGQLLDGYIAKTEDDEVVRKWWEIYEGDVEDEYLFENVCRHLASSGNVEELIRLLLSGEWSMFRHEFGGLSAWKGDFWEYLKRKSKDGGSENEKETERGLEMVRDAVAESWAFVHENRKELGYQVVGRLIDCENEIVRRYLRAVEDMQCSPWLKPIQRCWERPGEGMMIGEFDIGDDVWDIALHKKSLCAVVGVGTKVAILDLKEMRVVARCIDHSTCVWKVGISSDGRKAFSWSGDGTVRKWNVESGEELQDERIRIDGEESDEDDNVVCSAFSPEKGFVVTGSHKGKIKLWNLGSGERVGHTVDASERVNCIAVSPNERIIAVGLCTDSLVLYDLETCRPLCEELKGHVDKIEDITFSSNGQLVASCACDGTIRLWDVESKTQLGDPFVHCGDHPLRAPRCVSFGEDSKQLFSGSEEGRVKVWDVADGTEVHSWEAHTRQINCVAVTGNVGNRWALSGSEDHTVRVWDLQATRNGRDEHNYHKNRVSCVGASTDGSFFVSASWDKTLRIWDGADGRPLGEALCGHEDCVTSVAVSPDNRRVVSGSWDYTVRVWDVETGAQVGDALQAHEDIINCVAYSPNGEFMVSGSEDRSVRVWRVTDSRENGGDVGESASELLKLEEAGAHGGMSNREPFCLERTLRHDVPDEERNAGNTVHSLAMSRDGRRLLVGLESGEIWVWDMNSGSCVDRKQSGHTDIVRIEISERNEVLAMDFLYQESRWQLDNERGLTRVVQNEASTGLTQAESQELIDVVCRGRNVQLRCSDKKIATLPSEVDAESWTYNAKTGVLCVGLEDGRVLFFRIDC